MRLAFLKVKVEFMFSSPLESKFPHLILSVAVDCVVLRRMALQSGPQLMIERIVESDYAPNALVDPSARRRFVQRFKSSESLRSERTKRERERDNERQLNGSFLNYDRKYMVKNGSRKHPHRAQKPWLL